LGLERQLCLPALRIAGLLPARCVVCPPQIAVDFGLFEVEDNFPYLCRDQVGEGQFSFAALERLTGIPFRTREEMDTELRAALTITKKVFPIRAEGWQ